MSPLKVCVSPPAAVKHEPGTEGAAQPGTSTHSGRVRKAPTRTLSGEKKQKSRESEDVEYAVEEIRGARKVGSKWEYLVKWENYPE